jgi:DNA-directed RNA polymerase beta' subunit
MRKIMGKRRVRIIRRNWNRDYYYDIINGIGFTISEPAEIEIDERAQKAMYGSRSPLYGTDYSDEQAFIERYRCKCGEFKGQQFEGETCPLCGTKIEFKDVDIEKTGWISLGNNYIIQPYYYNLLCAAIGKQVVPEIITAKNKVDTDGHLRKLRPEEIEEKPKHPYVGIGLVEFMERFEEVMLYFKAEKKKKADMIDRIIKEKSAVFVRYIPIYSTKLRPQSYTSDTYYFNSYDKHVNPLYRLSENIKNAEEIDKYLILSRIQTRVNKLWDLNFDFLHGKDGHIQDQILGGSLNNTSRNVIIPDPTLEDNQVDVSYHTFLELFKYRIIYYLMKMNDNMTLSKAYYQWATAFVFDRTIYEIMLYIIEKDKPKLLLNRNPTLNYYSMLLMTIRNVKEATDDYTLSVPLSILPGLNADFDGDILNIIAILLEELKHAFRKFDPISRMIISRDTDLLNEYFTITKGQLIDLHHFATL